MSLWSDYEVDFIFSRDYPHGVPSDTWTDRFGKKHALCYMPERYIRNCMALVGEDDPWYARFYEELQRRERLR